MGGRNLKILRMENLYKHLRILARNRAISRIKQINKRWKVGAILISRMSRGKKLHCVEFSCVSCRTRQTRALCQFDKSVKRHQKPMCQKCIQSRLGRLIIKKYSDKYRRIWANFKEILRKPIIQRKIRETFRRKYGVGNAMQVPGVAQKVARTCIDKYGCSVPAMLSTCDRKVAATKGMCTKVQRGTTPSSLLVIEKFRQTMRNKTPEELKRIKSQKLTTWKRNHNTKAKINELFSRCQKVRTRFVNTRFGRINYQSLFELRFIQLCEKSKDVLDLKRGPTIKYANSWYLSDFLVTQANGLKLVVEIKSEFLFKRKRLAILEKARAARVWAKNRGMKYCLLVCRKAVEMDSLWMKALGFQSDQ